MMIVMMILIAVRKGRQSVLNDGSLGRVEYNGKGKVTDLIEQSWELGEE